MSIENIKEKIKSNNSKSGKLVKKVIFGGGGLVKRKIRNFKAKKYKINNNQIMFITFQGSFTCNPKAITEEIIKRKLPYRLVWVERKENDSSRFPKEVKLVQRNSMDFYKEMSSSKIIIENSTNVQYLNYTKKPEQIYIQTWHGSFGLKKSDPDSVKNKRWLRKAIKGGELADYCISNSEFENNYYRSTYWKKSKILKVGHPRNDILFDANKDDIIKIDNKVRKLYNIKKDTKILLYAPTFRDDHDKNPYDIDYNRLIKVLEKKFGGKWCIMVRFHFNVRNNAVLKLESKNIINVTRYDDMQELLCVADIGITDYSSWICDFVLTGKPCFLYANDMQDYIKERGFYYNLDETPFAYAENNDELEKIINNYDEKKYQIKKKKYLDFVGCFENGSASSKVVDEIEKIIDK